MLFRSAFAFYAQDTWKVSRKLTVDYGLRWDYSTYMSETYGRQATLDPTKPNLAAGGQPGATTYQATCGCEWSHNYPYAFGPRLGGRTIRTRRPHYQKQMDRVARGSAREPS